MELIKIYTMFVLCQYLLYIIMNRLLHKKVNILILFIGKEEVTSSNLVIGSTLVFIYVQKDHCNFRCVFFRGG